jgi:hypothetical protein
MTDAEMERKMARWIAADEVVRRKAERFDAIHRLLAPVLRPNETPEYVIRRLLLGD